ncbi:MAG: hypothetical protein KGP14_06205, partial [Betaproteobacteria bacterium]|nr:hypothetical protein [Betaproteobacteria bacterium]
ALRYPPPGGRVLVVARQRGGYVAIEVRDNGIGIASEHQAAIFAEFYQVGNAAREQNKGLGLGLSIVDRLAKALDIEITLKSRTGEGTCFTLHVSRCQPITSRPAETHVLTNAGTIHCMGDSTDLQGCAELVRQWGYDVTMLPSGDAGLHSRNAIVIADPENVDTLCAGGQAPDMPLIVLAGENRPVLPSGVHSLPTPLRPAKLRALLNQLQKTLSKSIP